MTRCEDCKFADWKRTANGRLHPDKSGRCTFEVVIPALPRSRYWQSRGPVPSGGYIERGKLDEIECPTFEATV